MSKVLNAISLLILTFLLDNTIQNRFSSEMHFLNIQQPQQFIEDNTFYNHLIPSERQGKQIAKIIIK
jgi:hypothetical protein